MVCSFNYIMSLCRIYYLVPDLIPTLSANLHGAHRRINPDNGYVPVAINRGFDFIFHRCPSRGSCCGCVITGFNTGAIILLSRSPKYQTAIATQRMNSVNCQMKWMLSAVSFM